MPKTPKSPKPAPQPKTPPCRHNGTLTPDGKRCAQCGRRLYL